MADVVDETEQQTERRSRVVRAAMDMASEGGYDAVQMRKVAERSGVALGTIYRYFNSKDELLLAGMAGWTRSVGRQLVASPPEGDSPAERLSSALCAAAHRTDAEPVLMGALITALASTSADLASYRLEIRETLHDIVTHAVGEEGTAHSLETIQRIIGHVWFSAITSWITGQTPDGTVCEELRFTAHALLD